MVETAGCQGVRIYCGGGAYERVGLYQLLGKRLVILTVKQLYLCKGLREGLLTLALVPQSWSLLPP